MSNLIKNELMKIFKKKSIYIALAIIFICVIAFNCLNKFSSQQKYGYYTQNIERMEESLANFDPDKPSDTATYIEIKTSIDQGKLIKKYGEDSWQATIINDKMMEILTQLNTLQFGIGKDQVKYEEKKKEYDDFIQKLDNNDWKYFAKTELDKVNQEIQKEEQSKAITVDKIQLGSIENRIKALEIQKQTLQWRLEKDISYAESEMNPAILNYGRYSQGIIDMGDDWENDHQTKVRHNTYIERKELAKYAIENGIAIDKQDTSRSMLMNFFNQYGIFIAAMIVMIAGTIICEEFNKGTIKLLLVRPYKRWKILLAKLITCIICFVIITAIIMIMQLLVGGIVFGFDSMQIPAVVYNHTTNQVETINMFSYLGLQTLTRLPMFLLIIAIAFMLGSIFTNSALSIIIALLGFMSTSIINMMAMELNLSFMKFFITPNWDLTPYLFGGIPDFPGITLGFSIIINILYFVAMLVPAFIAFNKKNIKNI